MQFRQSFTEEGGHLLVLGGWGGESTRGGGAGQLRGEGLVRPEKDSCYRPDLPCGQWRAACCGEWGPLVAVHRAQWSLSAAVCPGQGLTPLSPCSLPLTASHHLHGHPSWGPGEPGCLRGQGRAFTHGLHHPRTLSLRICLVTPPSHLNSLSPSRL